MTQMYITQTIISFIDNAKHYKSTSIRVKLEKYNTIR